MIDSLTGNDARYEVNGVGYVNKLTAFDVAFSQNVWPHWNFNDEVFSMYNWKDEPTETLFELYKQRAVEIRNSYSKVICWFTGGSDSDNMLRAFLEAGCTVDEIWYRSHFDKYSKVITDVPQEKLTQYYTGMELRLAVTPRIQEYKQKYPQFNPVIKIFDLSDSLDKWVTTSDNPYSTNHYSPFLPFKNSSLLESKDLSSPTIILSGIDKIRIGFKDNKFWAFFMDHHINSWCPLKSKTDLNEHHVPFYWNTGSAKMIIKQAHVFKKLIKKSPDMFSTCIKDPGKLFSKYINELNGAAYPFWSADIWNPRKGNSSIVFDEMVWFYNNPTDPRVMGWNRLTSNYSKEVNRIYSKLDPQNRNTSVDHGFTILPGCMSKWYCLGE